MKLGDFTELAHAYINRPAYSQDIINAILNYAKLEKDTIRVADIGAGTGKLTKVLLEMGISVDAVEPTSSNKNSSVSTKVTEVPALASLIIPELE